MFTSADLIDVLRRRRRRSIRPEAGIAGFPPGWADWLASMRIRAGAVTGATAAAIVAVLVARPPRPRPRHAGPGSHLAAWASLAYPLGEPGPRDERGLRRLSLASTLLIQVVWIGLLLLLMNARVLTSDTAASGESHVVQAIFIGAGTPDDAGGGATDVQPLPAPDPAIEPEPTASSSAPAPSVTPPVPADVAQPEDASAQVLQVTVTPMPDIAFTLPPPRARDAPQAVVLREREVPGPTMQAVEIADLRAPTPVVTPTPVRQRDVQVEVRERAMADIAPAAPAPSVTQRQITLDAPDVPAQTAPEITSRERAVPMRDPVPAAAPAQAAASEAAETTTSTAPETSGGGVAPGQAGASTSAPVQGRGPSPSAAPGAAPSTRAADDWGDGAVAQDGGQPGRDTGLFGADGRPRLADGGRVGGGLPPGTVTEDFAKIDRHGTWLRRPPTDYEPTSFDRFWAPSETLLEEWVRRSIKTVLIPIPGTSKTIQCNVALLAFGGGCGITDPNMQDVETDGRPPPDVPWKPELQEDQDSLGG